MSGTPVDRHAADSHDWIRVRGARENNLKDVSVDVSVDPPPPNDA